MTATLTPAPDATAAPGAPAPPGSAASAGLSPVAARSSDAARTMYAALAVGLGIIPLCSLTREAGWLFDAWFAVLIVVGPAALLRLRWKASAGQIWLGVVALVPYLTARFVHQHAIAGFIPGPGTWHQVHVLLMRLHHTTSTEVAPVHTTNAIRLVLCTVIALVAALIDMIAVVGRHGALAGVPLLVIYTISGAVPRRPVAWPLFACSAVAFLILLSVDARDDALRWGHFVPRSGLAKRRRAAGVISAQRIAVVAVLLAVILPAFVQAKSKNLLADAFHNGNQGGPGGAGLGAGGTGGIDPFVTLQGDLDRTSPVNLLTVKVQRLDSGTDNVQPFYARANVLSNYTGRSWIAASHGQLQDLASTGFASSPGTSYAPVTALFQAQVTIDGLNSDPPVFVQPRQLAGLTGATQWSQQDQILIGGTTQAHQTYQVTFQQPDPSVADLNAANAVDPALRPWLQLPQIAGYVTSLVSQLTAHATTQYQKALALDQYFTNPNNGFSYSLHVPAGNSGDPLVDFLQNKVGFCQQYAAALGVMLRVAGVPSRVVLGYTHPTPDTTGSFTITTNDAHAWVEAYFSGIGWVPFDPTPLSGIAGGAKNDLPWAPHATVALPRGSGVPVDPITKPHERITSSGGPAATTSSSQGGGAGLGPPIVGGVLAALVLVVASPWLQRGTRRRRRLRLARGGDVDAVWAELSDTATDLGYVWSPARSPRQVVDWLGRDAGAARPELAALAAAVEQARYAPAGFGSTDGRALVKDFDRVHAELAAGRATRSRVRARVLPASLGWTTNAGARLLGALRVSTARRARRH